MNVKTVLISIIGAGIIILLGLFAWHFAFFASKTASQAPVIALDTQIGQAYDNMQNLTFKPADENLASSLETLRDIAADTDSPVEQRVKALNGINFAYVASNFDAATVYEVVFSKPPFSASYIASASSSDPVHPNAFGDTAAVDSAIIKLNAYSNSLLPNHYAIARMEVAKVFEYERAVSVNPTQKIALKKAYAEQLKQLTKAYDALPDIESQGAYPTHLMLQLMYLQASSLSFIGSAEADQTYLDNGEKLYLHAIGLGADSLKSDPTNMWVKNSLNFARMFYVVNYWYPHKKAGSLQSLITVADALADDYDANVPLYSQYIPAHRDGKVEPSTTLRVISKKSTKLKSLLESSGWKF